MGKEHASDLELANSNRNGVFTLTPHVKEISTRALIYLKAGYPVHLKGPAGTGKTATALYIARLIGKPVTIIFGNEGVETSDMVGLQYGFRMKVIEDNFIHSVHKRVEDFEQKWISGRIIDACEKGDTLIYDEFTRSRPETNNILLSVLEEKILELPINYYGENKLIKVHPEFKAIFTSNPEEYAGVYKSQDALIDRFITIELDFPDKSSEINIAKSVSGISSEDANILVTVVRNFRDLYKSMFVISLRDSIKLCKIVHMNKIPIDLDNNLFRRVCIDVITSGISAQKTDISITKLENDVDNLINIAIQSQYLRGNKNAQN